MKTLLLAILLLALTGCRSVEYTAPNGVHVKMTSFLVKTTWASFSMSTNGLVKLDKLNSDQISGTEAIVAAAVKGAIQGMK